MHNNKVVFYRTISAVAATSLVLGATPLAHAATNTPKGSGETSVTAHMGRGNADIPISLLQGNNIVETANTDESGTVTLSTKGGENTSTNLELQLPEEYTISNATCVAENPDNGTTSQDIPLANTTPQNVTSPNTDTEEQKSPQDEFYEEAKEVMFADIETNPYNFDPVKTLQFALENGLIEAKDSFPEQYRVGYTPTQAEIVRLQVRLQVRHQVIHQMRHQRKMFQRWR